jgi:hypothetical protein
MGWRNVRVIKLRGGGRSVRSKGDGEGMKKSTDIARKENPDESIRVSDCKVKTNT